MKSLTLFILIPLALLFITNSDVQARSSKRAAINIWLQEQQDIYPRPMQVFAVLKDVAKMHKISIINYNMNKDAIQINAKTRTKSNIYQLQRLLGTNFMFENIILNKPRKKNGNYYFNLKLKKTKSDKREIYSKSKHEIFKSQTQVKYSIKDLIKNIQATRKLTQFCPATPLKVKPTYVGARVKLVIYSYNMNFSGSFNDIKKAITLISDNKKYISMHNLRLAPKKASYELDVDLRFYQQDSRRNSLDKAFIYAKVVSDKVCN